MTNQVVKQEAQPPKPPVTKGGALAALVPKDIDETFRLAKALSSAGDMIPQHFRNKPEAVMTAIIRGMEVGLAPMQALSNIAVINGRASLWGDALPALMQKAGHHVDVEIEGEWPDAVATATLTRGDTGKTVVRRFSGADAKRAGLAGKQGPWQQYPTRMLMHRARAWAIRDGAADALMGLQIADEMQDIGPDHARDITPRRGSTTFIPAGSEPEAKGEVDEIHEAETVSSGDLNEDGLPDVDAEILDPDELQRQAFEDSNRQAEAAE